MNNNSSKEKPHGSNGKKEAQKESINALILATTFPRWENDKHPKFIFELSKELEKNGIEVTVLAPHDAGAKRREEIDGISIRRFPYFIPYRFQKLAYGSGILPTIKSNPLTLFLIPFFLASLIIHAGFILIKDDIQVVNSHWVVPNGIVASLLSKVFGVQHVSTLHAGGVLGLKNIPGNSVIATAVNQYSDGIMPVSSHISEKFFQMIPSGISTNQKIHIQPMGAHTSDFDIDSKSKIREARGADDKIIALYVGRLAEKKGITHLLDATSELVEDYDNFKLVVVGRGVLKEDLKVYTSQQNLKDYVEFTGWVSEEELHNRYVMADFVVVPSIETNSGDTEGMPTVISEAFAAGNPVIGTNVGGIPDVVNDGENGYVVPQKDSLALAQTMRKLIEDGNRREVLSEGALTTAEKLDWEPCGEAYANLFTEVYKPDTMVSESKR